MTKTIGLLLLLLLPVTIALAQLTPDQTAGFCPPPNAKLSQPIPVLDDICTAMPGNGYRMQVQAPPLSFKQKAIYFRENKIFSGSGIFGAAFFGMISEVRHDPPQWPQGAQGFGDQFGTRYAQGLAKSTAEFLFGFKEDPRPNPPPQPMVFRDGVWQPNKSPHSHRPSTRFGSRLGRALLGVVWTHYDSGRDEVAFSRIGGAVASGVVGIAWTPAPENTWGQVGVRTASAFGGYAANAVFQEFQPDLTKLLARITGQSATPKLTVGPPSPDPSAQPKPESHP